MPFLLGMTGAVFSQDPRISLMKFIKENWGATTVPPVENVTFDTKFAKMTPNQIIVEKMPRVTTIVTLGAQRTQFVDTYRVQIYCHGHSAIDNKFKMEQRVEDIIQGNATGIQTVEGASTGIDWAEIDSFEEITTYSDADMTKGVAPARAGMTARSSAIVKLHYDKYVS